MSLKRVVVTGLGAVTPLGNNIPDTWEAMLNGVSGSAEITHFDTSKYKTKFACEVKNFNVKDFLDRKEARKLDPYAQYGIISADEAIRDATLDLDRIDKDRVGVIWASGIGGLDTFTDEVGKFVTGDGTPRFSPFFIPKMIADIAAGHISIKHGLRGPNYATVSACASSAHSLADAFNLIRLGKTDVFVTGGSEAAITSAGVGGFNAMHAISTRNDDPKTASRPFDKDRDGFVLGEGGGAVVFEELNHALERGAKIYAEVVGTGMTGDAHHMTSPHPEGEGARRSMKMAIDEAGINPKEIDHVNTHGTSTPLGDIAEIKAIKKLFGDEAYNININSTKSMTGHLLGAAGSVEAIATILAVKHDQVPPTINHSTDDPEIDNKLNFSFGEKAISRKVNVALSNTFGFGGHNATLVFKKYTE
ncbi:MAG: beta-ketoacyl-ACP synthase II [Bacteroidales bacterium]|nr:beta-ketoacyl-ACP synthase II [Bacteroidales bacterium]MCF8333648.1 beta-ketoacyl-ACP synthase II [Bacteroidales bacterium]